MCVCVLDMCLSLSLYVYVRTDVQKRYIIISQMPAMSNSISPADPHLQVSTKATEMEVVNFQKASPAPGVQASVGR